MPYCTYCGSSEELSRDHVIPVSYTHLCRTFTDTRCVPACAECNALLGDRMLPTVADRAAYLAQRLAQRHRKFLFLPKWDSSDLEELGPRLRASVEFAQANAAVVRARISNCRTVATSGAR
jgi:hypothetical protein